MDGPGYTHLADESMLVMSSAIEAELFAMEVDADEAVRIPNLFDSDRVNATLAVGRYARASSNGRLIPRQTYPRELPTRRRREKVAVAHPDMVFRRDTGAATQDILIYHEFAVVLTHGAIGDLKPRVRSIARLGPFPCISETLGQAVVARRTGMKNAGIGKMTRWRRKR